MPKSQRRAGQGVVALPAFALRKMALGKLVPFQQRPNRKPAEVGAPREGQVVLFTGVRYERAAPEPGKPPATSGNKRKRG